jgi:phage tail sheath protein FI
MPVQTSYPGVYVQEVPSGVRTISGVATSIATFVGRARMGPMFQPVLCLNYSDFERTFSSDTSLGDMARSIRLFFLNGGTQCYVVRVANGAIQSAVDLKNEAMAVVLGVTAKSAGLIGDTIRMAVTYNSAQPESLFNLEVFRWVKNSAGLSVKTDVEKLTGLSMNPNHPRYAGTYISQESKLVNATDKAVAPAGRGFSLSGPIPANILNAASPGKQFSISVNGNAPVTVDLGAAAIADLSAAGALTAMQTAINTAASPETVTVTSTAVGTHIVLKIEATNGDVLVQPAATNDVTGKLMLGTAQGGIEVSKYAAIRPAASGITFQIGDFNAFAAIAQNSFNRIALTPTSAASAFVNFNNTLQTTGAANPMFQDNITGSVSGHSDGVREKWAIIADAINAQRNTDPAFPWSAELWGSRLAILPVSGGDNTAFTLVTSGATGTNIGPAGSDFFTINTRYYSLGTLGAGSFQGNGVPGNDGTAPLITDYRLAFDNVDKEVDLFNLLILPRSASVTSATANTFWGEASAFCLKRRAFLLMDAPEEWDTVQKATNPTTGVNSLRMGLVKDHSAVFYPRLTINENGLNQQVAPSGAIAGLMARIDASRGVWKAAAGTEADLRGVTGLEHRFSDGENGVLNPRAVNTIRIFPNGIVNWGARTMDGDDDFGSEYKYIPIRRTALFIEESLYRGLKWVVFEPNDEPLWSQIRLNVGAFMHNLFRQGAFQGKTKQDAYFVKCDSETTTQNDINLGIVNIWVGFAPLKPAEFVVLYLQQMTGQIQV